MDGGGYGDRDSKDSITATWEMGKTKSGFCNKCGAWKGQLGLEPTFDLFTKHLCDIFDEVKRVLRKDGTCFVNLGDTYYGSGAGTQKNLPEESKSKEVYTMPYISHKHTQRGEWKRPSRDAYAKGTIKKNCLMCGKEFYGKENSQFCSRECLNKKGNDFRSQNRLLKDKCLTMIPQRFAIEMVNKGWILRNTIIWKKPNCMPSSVKDRFTVDFEYIFFFVKNKKYWFEQQVDKTQAKYIEPRMLKEVRQVYQAKYKDTQGVKRSMSRNKRCVWQICPKPFKEAHFAVYPEELCETPIKAGCPEFVCLKCGKPKKVIYTPSEEYAKLLRNQGKGWSSERRKEAMKIGNALTEGKRHDITADYKISFKPDCNCNAEFTGGIVLDPFFGSGTTGLVALKQNKKFIGIELNPEYIEIAKKRLKPLLEQKKLK